MAALGQASLAHCRHITPPSLVGWAARRGPEAALLHFRVWRDGVLSRVTGKGIRQKARRRTVGREAKSLPPIPARALNVTN
jgi:hypothetical protein